VIRAKRNLGCRLKNIHLEFRGAGGGGGVEAQSLWKLSSAVGLAEKIGISTSTLLIMQRLPHLDLAILLFLVPVGLPTTRQEAMGPYITII
jgi:hypothetical protein